MQGLKLRCRVDGAAGAPWLVFSNSLMTDMSLWDDQPTLARWLRPGTVQADPPALHRIRGMIAGTPLQGFVRATRALQDYDYRFYPAVLRCPAAFIAGAEDGMLPQVMRGMAAACPGSTFTALKGAGHLPNIEQPACFNAALDALLARPSGSA